MFAVRNIHEFRPFVNIANFFHSESFATYGMPNNPLHPETSVLYVKAIKNGCLCISLVPRASALISVWVEEWPGLHCSHTFPKVGGGGGGEGGGTGKHICFHKSM